MKIQKEKPFEYLRRKDDGKLFGEEIVKNWYLARAYVLDKLKGIAFKPSSDEHLHVVVNGDNAMMLFVVRQVALFAHLTQHNVSTITTTVRMTNRIIIRWILTKSDKSSGFVDRKVDRLFTEIDI